MQINYFVKWTDDIMINSMIIADENINFDLMNITDKILKFNGKLKFYNLSHDIHSQIKYKLDMLLVTVKDVNL